MPPSPAATFKQIMFGMRPLIALSSPAVKQAHTARRLQIELLARVWTAHRTPPDMRPLPVYTPELERQLTQGEREAADRAEYSGADEAADHYHATHP